MKINLEEKLDAELKKHKKSQKPFFDAVDSVTKFLEDDVQNDSRILQLIAPNSSYGESLKEKDKVLELEKVEKFLRGKVFTLEQILNLGVKYRLKFLPMKDFKSYVDPGVVHSIKDLERQITKSMVQERVIRENKPVEEIKVNFTFSDYDFKEKFYVLAPGNCFNLKKSSLIEVQDPIAFYKYDDTHYYLLKKWGKDFTIYRRFLGFYSETESHYDLINILKTFLISSVIFLGVNYFVNVKTFWFFILVLTGLRFIGSMATSYKNDSFGKAYVTSKNVYYKS